MGRGLSIVAKRGVVFMIFDLLRGVFFGESFRVGRGDAVNAQGRAGP